MSLQNDDEVEVDVDVDQLTTAVLIVILLVLVRIRLQLIDECCGDAVSSLDDVSSSSVSVISTEVTPVCSCRPS